MNCLYCGKKSINQYCFAHKPRPALARPTKRMAVNKPIKKIGKQGGLWIATRKQWIRDNPGGWHCYLCGLPLDSKTLTLDHVLARSRRPDLRNDMSNLKPACWPCNHKKGSRAVDVLI